MTVLDVALAIHQPAIGAAAVLHHSGLAAGCRTRLRRRRRG
jgi:hypothetical protein